MELSRSPISEASSKAKEGKEKEKENIVSYREVNMQICIIQNNNYYCVYDEQE